MLSSNDIRNIKFSKSVGGYKQEEVEIFLDKVENDYEQYEHTLRELSEKINSLNKQIDSYKETQNSIQSVLLSAQKLADQIVDEAKAKSEEIISNAEANISIITAREKELSNAFELKASERKAIAEAEINEMLAEAKRKNEAIEKATEAAVNRQQMLFDRLKVEITAFKADITKKYKEHLELLQKLPDTSGMDPARIVELMNTDFSNEEPRKNSVIENVNSADLVVEAYTNEATTENDGFSVVNDEI